MKQVWKTEKEKELNSTILEYISGEDLESDKHLLEYDIKVNKAHAKMLANVGLISQEDLKGILAGLEEIEKNGLELKPEYEDVHMNIENALGKSGEKLHTVRSRNDQVMADLNLFMKDKIAEVQKEIEKFQKVLQANAEKYKNCTMPGYTHMQAAQPITFGYWFECYNALFKEDMAKLKNCLDSVDVNPLGACALAGTSLPIDIDFTTKELGFSKKFENALATISSRGEAETNVLFCLNMVLLHLSKMAQDLILYSTKEFGMVELDGSVTTGSSIMPQKKNPDVLETVRGKSSEMIALLVENLMLLKALPSGYNKDTQLTKKNIIKGFEIALSSIGVMKIVVENLKPNKEQMAKLVQDSGCLATEEANKLVKEGVPFRKAHQKIRNLYI